MIFGKNTGDGSEMRNLPSHIGIIMDGNGRWAKERGKIRSQGHIAGAKTFKTITRYCASIGIKHLTVYAFSTENWSRPIEEVGALMKLFKVYLEEALTDFLDENIKVKFLGDTTRFSPELQKLIHDVEDVSSKKTGMVLNLAMNYGGRDDIVYSVKQLAEMVKKGELEPSDINEKMISDHLYTEGQPDPDLIIRPSGEQRLSNFMVWQAAYSELVYFDILWPDFTTDDLERAIDIYNQRNRRFGGV